MSTSPLHTEGVKPGVYAALKVNPDSRQKVLDFCENQLHLDMSNSASPYASVTEGMHTTLLAAKDAKDQSEHTVAQKLETSKSEFVARPTRWEIFKSPNTGAGCLVLHVESDEIREFHKKLSEETGLKHAFDDFKMHISVHYNYTGELPKELPDIEIKYDSAFTKPYHFVQKVSTENKDTISMTTTVPNGGAESKAFDPKNVMVRVDLITAKFREEPKLENEITFTPSTPSIQKRKLH